MSDPVTIVLLGQPVPWARAGGRGKQRFTPTKQRNNAATLRLRAIDAICELNEQPAFNDAIIVKIVADMQIPASWSKRQKNAAIIGKIHPIGRPDIDNIVKQILDALKGIVYTEDARICKLVVCKRYGVQPKLVITVELLDEIATSQR